MSLLSLSRSAGNRHEFKKRGTSHTISSFHLEAQSVIAVQVSRLTKWVPNYSWGLFDHSVENRHFSDIARRNLSWGTTDDSLREAFSQFGTVTDSVCSKLSCQACQVS